MDNSDDITVLRARDFWSAIGLFFLSLFFLWKTSQIPLFGANRAGVSADWFNSAALVPLGIFGGMLVLSIVLFVIAIKAGGAQHALSSIGLGWDKNEALRFTTIAAILTGYIVGLVPRVDFIISSALLITALIYGYRGGHRDRMVTSSLFVFAAGLYAFVTHLPQSQWKAHGDDWVVLLLWIGLVLVSLAKSKSDKVARLVPLLSVLAPFILVCAMAFGFRQNVPNRTGLIFSQIEYNYYVNLKPLWSR
ncbi:hypothetical protein NBRC116601_23830 [Cognatishimia sp. WU-CL00825]|uniref:hypothetical protein n=1 Tax=Cognatishimia sp. WU-CL00825 TaxID=3127658 RepID=UPI00310C0E83